MVALLKEFYGRGPTRTKTYFEDDLVVCLLRGGFSRVEQSLLEGGRGASVIQQRMEFQDLMRERFEGVIEDATGRRVIGFMRSSSSPRPRSSTITRSPRATRCSTRSTSRRRTDRTRHRRLDRSTSRGPCPPPAAV
jgi:uncharacterized protein YbcI